MEAGWIYRDKDIYRDKGINAEPCAFSRVIRFLIKSTVITSHKQSYYGCLFIWIPLGFIYQQHFLNNWQDNNFSEIHHFISSIPPCSTACIVVDFVCRRCGEESDYVILFLIVDLYGIIEWMCLIKGLNHFFSAAYVDNSNMHYLGHDYNKQPFLYSVSCICL